MTRVIFADDTNLTICINENNIETFRYYILYCQLGWNDHSKKIKSKMANNVFILNRVNHL